MVSLMQCRQSLCLAILVNVGKDDVRTLRIQAWQRRSQNTNGLEGHSSPTATGRYLYMYLGTARSEAHSTLKLHERNQQLSKVFQVHSRVSPRTRASPIIFNTSSVAIGPLGYVRHYMRSTILPSTINSSQQASASRLSMFSTFPINRYYVRSLPTHLHTML